MDISIGADPELFLKKGRNFISAETKDGPIIPGTKQEPFPVKGGAIQIDGVAAEFNVNPSNNFEDFITNITDVITDLKKRVKRYDPKISLVPTPTATFDDDYFYKLPKHTLELGCEPDFDAWNDGKINPRPQTDKAFRTGSGHIHIGWTKGIDPKSEGHMKDCIMIVQELDKYLLPVASLWDKDNKRRELYGKQGSFRPKPFGVEYRPLSNAWLKNYDSTRAVYDLTTAVVKSLGSGKHEFRQPQKINTKSIPEAVNQMRGYLSA